MYNFLTDLLISGASFFNIQNAYYGGKLIRGFMGLSLILILSACSVNNSEINDETKLSALSIGIGEPTDAKVGMPEKCEDTDDKLFNLLADLESFRVGRNSCNISSKEAGLSTYSSKNSKNCIKLVGDKIEEIYEVIKEGGFKEYRCFSALMGKDEDRFGYWKAWLLAYPRIYFYERVIINKEGSNADDINWDNLKTYFAMVQTTMEYLERTEYSKEYIHAINIGKDNIQKRVKLKSRELNEIFFQYLYSSALEEKELQETQMVVNSVNVWRSIQKYAKKWTVTLGEFNLNTNEEVGSKLFKLYQGLLEVSISFYDAIVGTGDHQLEIDQSILKGRYFAITFADAIAPLMDRIDILVKAYDIACKVQKCDKLNDFRSTRAVHWVLKYLTYQLDQQISGDHKNKVNIIEEPKFRDRPIVQKLISRLYQSKVALSTNLRILNVNDQHLFDRGPYLNPFVNIFSQGARYYRSYQSTGSYSGKTVKDIQVGFSKELIDKQVAIIRARSQSYQLVFDKMENSSVGLIKEFNNLKNIDQQAIREKNKFKKLLKSFMLKKADIDRIRFYIVKTIKNNSDLLDQVGEHKKCKENCKNGFAQFGVEITGRPQDETTFVVDTANLPPNNWSNNLHDLAVRLDGQAIRFKANSENILRVSVDGQWNPICALQASQYATRVNLGSLAGPGGFMLMNSKGSSEVNSVNNYSTKEKFASLTASAEVCAGGKFGPAGSASACVSASMGTRHSRGTSRSHMTSTENRTNASFSAGIRLINTPLPNLPVGSLILVEIPQAAQEKNIRYATDIRVLQGMTTIIVKEDSEYFLVGNDCQGRPNGHKLTVNVQRFEAKGKVAEKVAKTFIKSINEIEGEISLLLKSGTLPGETKEKIRKRILSENSEDALSAIEEYRHMFLSWLDEEFETLKLKANLVGMERDLARIAANLMELGQEIEFRENKQRLQQAYVSRMLMSLDLNYFNKNYTETNLENSESLPSMLDSIDSELITLMHFRYNNILDRLGPDLNKLKTLDIDTNFLNLFKATNGLVKSMLNKIAKEDSLAPDARTKTIVLRIPNVFIPSIANNHELPSFKNRTLLGIKNNMPVLSFEKSRRFWSKLKNIDYQSKKNRNLVGDQRDVLPDFEIIPEDLYNSQVVSRNGIPCSIGAPIIEKMALFFIHEYQNSADGDFFNQGQKEVELIVEDKVTIPYGGYNSHYNIVANNWRLIAAPVRIASNIQSALSIFDGIHINRGKGIPPFTRFSIDKFEGIEKSCPYNDGACDEDGEVQMIGDEYVIDPSDIEGVEGVSAGTLREAVIIMKIKSMLSSQNTASHLVNCQ